MNKFELWMKIARGYTLPQSIMPYIFAVILAATHTQINPLLSILGLVSVVAVQASVNMLDDYFDWKKGSVKEYKKLLEEGMQARTHKCFYIEENLVSLNQILFVALFLDFLACLSGFYIALKVGFEVIIIAAIAGFLGLFYSASPFKLSYRGLGEIAIGIIFGPLIMLGAYITAGASPDNLIIFSSIITGILIANVAFTHAIMDFDADKKVGKISLPIVFKNKTNAIHAQISFYLIAYALLLIGVAKNIYPPQTLITFITLPMCIGLFKLMKNQDKTKKIWMGNIPNWKDAQKEGSDWFMLRLCLAGNIVVGFVSILAISYCLFG